MWECDAGVIDHGVEGSHGLWWLWDQSKEWCLLYERYNFSCMFISLIYIFTFIHDFRCNTTINIYYDCGSWFGEMFGNLLFNWSCIDYGS